MENKLHLTELAEKAEQELEGSESQSKVFLKNLY